MAALRIADFRGDLAGGDLRRGAVSLAIMGAPLGQPWPQRQHRGPVHRLYLGFITHAGH